MPFFSIITITKQNSDGFRKTKQSIESQSFKDFEWIVIDGDVEPDNGIYDAMNKGLSRAQGDYVVFMNAGDIFFDFNVLRDIFDDCNGADLIYGDAIEGEFYKKARPHNMIACGLFTHHQAMYYKRTTIADLRYDEAYPIAADYKFTAQVILNDALAHYIPKPLCVFEMGGVSQRNAAQGRAEQAQIRRELGVKSTWWVPVRQWAGCMFKRLNPSLFYKIRI